MDYHAIDSWGPAHPLNPNPNPKNSKIDSQGQSEYHAIDSRLLAHPLNPNPNPKNSKIDLWGHMEYPGAQRTT